MALPETNSLANMAGAAPATPVPPAAPPVPKRKPPVSEVGDGGTHAQSAGRGPASSRSRSPAPDGRSGMDRALSAHADKLHPVTKRGTR